MAQKQEEVKRLTRNIVVDPSGVILVGKGEEVRVLEKKCPKRLFMKRTHFFDVETLDGFYRFNVWPEELE